MAVRRGIVERRISVLILAVYVQQHVGDVAIRLVCCIAICMCMVALWRGVSSPGLNTADDLRQLVQVARPTVVQQVVELGVSDEISHSCLCGVCRGGQKR